MRKTDYETLRILMAVLVLLTFFSALPVMDDILILAAIDMSVIANLSSQTWIYLAVWSCGILAQCAIIASFFWIKKRSFRLVILIAPLLFLLSKLLILTIFGLVLIPFLVLWISILVTYKKAVRRSDVVYQP